jgi:hypothetical protein
MSGFIEDLEAIRVHQIASECLQNVFSIKSSKTNFEIFAFFQFFSELSQ